MAVSSSVPNTFKSKLIDGTNINLASGGDTIKVMLLDENHTTNIDTQEFIDDVSANEISATGYTAGGQALTSQTVSTDDTDDEGVADADNPTWTFTSSVTIRYAAYYKDTGTPGTSPILFIVNLGLDYTLDNGDFTLTHNAEGYLNINDAA